MMGRAIVAAAIALLLVLAAGAIEYLLPNVPMETTVGFMTLVVVLQIAVDRD